MVLLSVSDFIGRFHPLVVHLPIGILLIALLLQWLSQKPKYAVSHGVLKLLWALGAGFALISCITGYLLSVHNEYDDTAVALHMWAGIAVAAISLLLLAKVAARQYDAVYKGGAIFLLLLITITGHLGGSLTHGSDYLFEALDDKNEVDSAGIKPIANVQEADVYADVVQPIFQTKCYSCHGAKKQKGGLRLDDTTRLLKGGEDGPVLLRGDAEESDLVKSLLLPREAKKHMPPKEKGQLTEAQIALVHWWVAQGAPFAKKISSLPQPEGIKPALASLQHGEMKKLEETSIPAAPVAPGDAKAIAALRKCGVVVVPVAQGSNYLSANFSTAPGITNKEIALLAPLQKQVVELKLSRAAITDSALNVIAGCTQLYTLWLDYTAITNEGLKNILSLKNLRLLNLVGTPVTASGLLQLQSLKNLKRLYIYQTNTTPADRIAVQKTLAHVQVDTGGYSVPTLASDTTVVTKATR